MQIVSEIINIPIIASPTVEYVEQELKKKGVCPLRWAIVKISANFYKAVV